MNKTRNIKNTKNLLVTAAITGAFALFPIASQNLVAVFFWRLAMEQVVSQPGLLRAADQDRVAEWFSCWVTRDWFCHSSIRASIDISVT